MSPNDSPETVVIVNPNSGNGQHTDAIRSRAELQGYELWVTEAPGDAIELARDAAASDASTVVAAGGDGTVNEVVRGIDQGDAFEEVTLGVIPAGTGNNFAGNIGVTGIDEAFDVLENGRRRRIDLARTDEHPFVNSCVAGLTAESSGKTSDEMKRRLGVLAYVITTLRSVAEFESLPIAVEIYENGTEKTAWEGDAMVVLVGNARRFIPGDDSQANVEDGLLEVAVVEDVSTIDLMSDAVAGTLFGTDSRHVRRFRGSAIQTTLQNPESMRFSLDGEIVQRRSLSIYTDPETIEVAVGDAYEVNPDRR